MCIICLIVYDFTRVWCAENHTPQDHFRCVMMCYRTRAPQKTRPAQDIARCQEILQKNSWFQEVCCVQKNRKVHILRKFFELFRNFFEHFRKFWPKWLASLEKGWQPLLYILYKYWFSSSHVVCIVYLKVCFLSVLCLSHVHTQAISRLSIATKTSMCKLTNHWSMLRFTLARTRVRMVWRMR